MKNNSGAQVIFVMLLCAGALCVSGCAKREIRNVNSKGKNIICFGDSITLGYGVEQEESYPAALAKITPYPVINAGVDGDTTARAAKRFAPDVLEKDPLLVIIELSANDFLKKIPMETTLQELGDMIDKAHAKGAMVAVVDISAGMFMREYRKNLGRLAREKDAIFIPAILSGILTNPSLKSDYIHPSAAGYKIIAQKIRRAISPYLTKNSLIKEKAEK